MIECVEQKRMYYHNLLPTYVIIDEEKKLYAHHLESKITAFTGKTYNTFYNVFLFLFRRKNVMLL